MRRNRVGRSKAITAKIGVDRTRGRALADFLCYIRCYTGLKETGKGH